MGNIMKQLWSAVSVDLKTVPGCSKVLFIVIVLFGFMTPCLAERVIEEGLVGKLRPVKITIRGEKLQVDQLLRAIARKSGVNVLVDESITDTISLDLEDVSLYDLFHLVLATKELHFYETNQALIVEREADYKKDLRDVVTTRLCPLYGQAAIHVDELSMLKSENGNLTLSGDGDCLVVRDHETNVKQIMQLLQELDKPIPQVHIKARIVTIDKSVSKELGVKWGYTDLENLPDDSLSASTDLGLLTPTTSIVFGFIRDSFTLDVELSALQQRNMLEILSEPRIVVLDGEEAEIKQGKEVPYESGTAENRNTSFREAVLSLKVTPKIMRNDFIKLDVKVTNDSVDEDSTKDGQPLLNRQEIKTNLFLEDGVTVVIGGILAKGFDETKGEVPWLADLPLIGGFFKSTDAIDRTAELLVFLTPTILDGKTIKTLSSKTIDRLNDAKFPSRSVPGLADQIAEPSDKQILLHPLEM